MILYHSSINPHEWKQIYSPDNVFFLISLNLFYYWDQVAPTESQFCTDWNRTWERKCQTQVASTEHLFKNISARWERDVAQKVRACNIRADFIVHAGVECMLIVYACLMIAPSWATCTRLGLNDSSVRAFHPFHSINQFNHFSNAVRSQPKTFFFFKSLSR